MIHIGICGNINPCIDYRCNFGGVCKVVNDTPICQCETCPDNFQPICGTNGQTYKYNFFCLIFFNKSDSVLLFNILVICVN